MEEEVCLGRSRTWVAGAAVPEIWPRTPWGPRSSGFWRVRGELRERLAVAQAEHKVLAEEKAMWLETRWGFKAYFVSFEVEPLRNDWRGGLRVSILCRGPKEKPKDAESEELRGLIATLEEEKAALIQEQAL